MARLLVLGWRGTFDENRSEILALWLRKGPGRNGRDGLNDLDSTFPRTSLHFEFSIRDSREMSYFDVHK